MADGDEVKSSDRRVVAYDIIEEASPSLVVGGMTQRLDGGWQPWGPLTLELVTPTHGAPFFNYRQVVVRYAE